MPTPTTTSCHPSGFGCVSVSTTAGEQCADKHSQVLWEIQQLGNLVNLMFGKMFGRNMLDLKFYDCVL